jgi:hypothetical protein
MAHLLKKDWIWYSSLSYCSKDILYYHKGYFETTNFKNLDGNTFKYISNDLFSELRQSHDYDVILLNLIK